MGRNSNNADISRSFVLGRSLRPDGTLDLLAATAAPPTFRAGLDEAESGSFVFVVLQILCNTPEFIVALLDEPQAEPALKQELRRLSAYFAWSFRRTLIPTPVTRRLRDMFPQLMAFQDASEVFFALTEKLWPAGGILGCVHITADQLAAGKSLEEACEDALDLKTDRPRCVASPPRVLCFILHNPDQWSFGMSIPERMAFDGLLYRLQAAILRQNEGMASYICYVCAQDGQWLRCEDRFGMEVSFADVVRDLTPDSLLPNPLAARTQVPVMLFYTPKVGRPDVEDLLLGTTSEVSFDNESLRASAPEAVDLLLLHRLSLVAKDVTQGSPSDSRDPSLRGAAHLAHQQGRPEAQVTALYLDRAARLWGVPLRHLESLMQGSGRPVDKSRLDCHLKIFEEYSVHAVKVAKVLRDTIGEPSLVTMQSRLASLFVLLHKATTPWEQSRLRSNLKRDLKYWLAHVDSLGVNQQTYLDLLLRAIPVTQEEEVTWQRQQMDAFQPSRKAREKLHNGLGLSSRPDFEPKNAWKVFCAHPCTCKGLPDTLKDLL